MLVPGVADRPVWGTVSITTGKDIVDEAWRVVSRRNLSWGILRDGVCVFKNLADGMDGLIERSVHDAFTIT